MVPEERVVFFNKLPVLFRELKKIGKEKIAKKIIKSWLLSTFTEDLDDKVNRFIEFGETGYIPPEDKYFHLFHELLGLYANGFFYSTVVMSGVICERMCYDILLNHGVMIGEYRLNENDLDVLYKMNLTTIIDLLNNAKLIKRETKNAMIQINQKRNNYVHPKKSIDDARKDCMYMINRIKKIIKNEFEITLN